jgi:hypothetical protein
MIYQNVTVLEFVCMLTTQYDVILRLHSLLVCFFIDYTKKIVVDVSYHIHVYVLSLTSTYPLT